MSTARGGHSGEPIRESALHAYSASVHDKVVENLNTLPEITNHVIIDGIANNQKARLHPDCGANSRYIDLSYVQTHEKNFTLIPLTHARKLGLATGKYSSSNITHVTKVALNLAGHMEEFYAFVTKLDPDYDIVLGRGWFDQHQPTIAWADGKLVLDTDFCR